MSELKNIVVFGANSAIAKALLRDYAQAGLRFFLCSRNREGSETLKNDLLARGASKVEFEAIDITELSAHKNIVEKSFLALDARIDLLLFAQGELSDQHKADQDFNYALNQLQINFISIISLITLYAPKFEEQKSGTIATISSVAADRGRKKLTLYCTAKAALSTYMQGLRQRMYLSNVNVLDIKPGFVDTPMTADITKNILFAKAETIAEDIKFAIEYKKALIYTPWFWRFIMLIVRFIPEAIFKKLKF
jgi:short-subunit dehydrogenase